MIEELIEKSKNFLPLQIESVEWNDPELIIQGKDWGFNTLSCWRLTRNNQYLCGSYDENSHEIVHLLIDNNIISLHLQSFDLRIDPAFKFSNEIVLEIFTVTSFEPWTFYIPGGPLYVSCPDNPRYIT